MHLDKILGSFPQGSLINDFSWNSEFMKKTYPDAVLPILQKLSKNKTGMQIFTPTDAIATEPSALRFRDYLRPEKVQTGSYYPFGGHLNINMPENRETFNIVKDFLY